jgi:tRNA pseudouridine38-40 synthase
MPRRTFRVDIAYRGTAFAGFSRQKGLRTVEATILQALQIQLPAVRRLSCAGRTDRGVHAEGQVVSFYTHDVIDSEHVMAAIQAAAPGEIACRGCWHVPRRFHATFAAQARRYRYVLPGAGAEAEKLDALVAGLIGRRCFSAFARDSKRPSSCHMQQARVRCEGNDSVFYFQADRFLKRQVRVMVATALRESRVHAPSDRLAQLAAQGDRRQTAQAIAADGLSLFGVAYDNDGTLQWSGPTERWPP